ncbi:MAG: phosphodiester glycosidase family protein [Gemmatirosa sp.]
MRRALAVALALPLLLGAARAAAPGLPDSALAVWRDGRWTTWWRSAHAPARWASPAPAITAGLRWRTAASGVTWSELRLAGDGEAWRVRVIVARVDPQRARLVLGGAVARTARGPRPAWTVDSAPARAALALNAGQFSGATPWGWLVHAGREYRAPGTGPLAPAVVVDTAGRVTIVPAAALPALRAAPTAAIARGATPAVREAFQSYPALLQDGAVPAPLHAADRGVDVAHRDARLAVCTQRDGRLLIALTRFDALDGALDVVPFGPTVPEMAALMGALGCRDAVLLDGGISGQLMLRASDGSTRRWPGLRRVPLGLVVAPRD